MAGREEGHLTVPRLALYFAPEPDTDLFRIGSAILGRDVETGKDIPQPGIPGIDRERFAVLTKSARHYGLHATLKAPFRMAPGRTEAELKSALHRFAAWGEPFFLSGLQLVQRSGFLVLAPAGPCPELDALEAGCVMEFDGFRAAAPPEELERRRAAGLTPEQEAMLERWGYPYVLREFRFHVTLTGTVTDPSEMRRVEAGLADLTREVCRRPVPVRSLCLFRQESLSRPFRLVERVPLGG